MRKIKMAAAGIVLFSCGILAGLMGPDVSVFKAVRAKSYEIWDSQRGGKVMDIGEQIDALDKEITKTQNALARITDTVDRLYSASALKVNDDQAADRRAMIQELTNLRRQLAAQHDEAMRASHEAMLDDMMRRANAAVAEEDIQKIAKELKSIRRELQGP